MPRLVALVAAAVLLGALMAALLLVRAEGADGRSRLTAAQQRTAQERAALGRAVERARARAPKATASGACIATVDVPGQGRSCRTDSGMFVVPRADGTSFQTHGPDLVSNVEGAAGAGGFGTADSIVCSPVSATRTVQLVYLLPSDFASGAYAVHGDRYGEVAPRMQQALLDAAAVVDTRAQELAPGTRRRLRVVCDDDGRPTVRRVVLPRSAASYAVDEGFRQLEEDLREQGLLPEYPGYRDQLLPAVLRTLAYYDAEFVPGIAGQGTMFDRTSLLESARANGAPMRANDPLISRGARNINNNPPSGPLAIQYATRSGGKIVEPHHGDLLHELSHTMGAVQSNVPTSSGAGHCTDGLDVMCYDDGGPNGWRFSPSICTGAPGAVAPLLPNGERYDCNADTYFHPAPPAGNPLRSSAVWQLGLAANQAFSTSTGSGARPKRVGRITVRGRGTRRTLRWPALAPTTGRRYEVGYRLRGSTDWQYLTTTRTSGVVPPLRPSSTYDISVAAIDRRMQVGPRRFVRGIRTGADNTPPEAPGALRLLGRSGSSITLRFVLSADNVRTTAYLVEQRVGTRWQLVHRLRAPSSRTHPAGATVTTRISGLFGRGATRVRIRAVDARGNRSTPSRTVAVRAA